MPRNSTETRLRAQARLEKATRKARATEEALSEQHKEQRKVLERTATLKAARLTRDAAEEAARLAPARQPSPKTPLR